MRLYAMVNYGCSNPSGIIVNLGYYALCECLVTKHTPTDTLYRWCGVEKKARRHGKSALIPVDVEKLGRIRKNRGLAYRDLAEMTGTSLFMFYRLFKLQKNGNAPGKLRADIVRILEEKLCLEEGELEFKEKAG